MDHQFLAHREAAIELAVDLCKVDLRRATERAAGGDLHQARSHGRLHDAFSQQGVAIGDLDAFELDVGADGQLAAPLRARLGRHCNSSRGWRQRGRRRGWR